MSKPTETRDPNVVSFPGSAPRRFPLLPILVLGAIAVGGAVTVFVLLQRRTADPIQEAKQRIDQRRQVEQEKAKAVDYERIAVAKRACQEAIDQGQNTLRLVTEYEGEVKSWNENVETLLTNERGKVLAGTPAYILAFQKLMEQRRPHGADAAAIRTRVSTLIEPVRAALAAEQSTYKPSAEFMAALEAENAAVIALIDQYRRPRLEVEALLRQAEMAGKPAEVTLERAMQMLDAQHADEQARAVAEAEETARKEADKRLTAARAEKILQDAEYREKQIKAEKELAAAEAESKLKELAAKQAAEKSRGETEATRIAEEARKQERIALAQSADVKAILSPLTAPGYYQPGVKAGESTDKIPISLSKLRSYGALQDSPEGLQKLLTVGTQPYWAYPEDKVRPRWPWPPKLSNLKPDQLEQLKQAQKYLREIDTVLVELKMLSE